MPFPKTIQLFLIDGEPTGRIACELSNWTGKAYKIPRIRVKDSIDRQELNNPGVYILFGNNAEGEPAAYIGEAEDVLYRLSQHLGSKEFWNEVVVFTTKDDYLNKAHIKYLENHLHRIASRLKRYHLYNGNIPNQPAISESEQAVMNEFLYHIRILTTTLGHKIFEEKRTTAAAVATSPSPQATEPVKKEEDDFIFYASSGKGANARGKPTAEGFVVFEGARFTKEAAPSFPNYYLKKREKLIKQGILVLEKNVYQLTEDYVFSSPSYAASVILARSSNGQIEWKLNNGTTLKDYEEG